MAVAVPVDEVESTQQFGNMPGACADEMGEAYLQLFSLSHSVYVTQLSIAVAMYKDIAEKYPARGEEGWRRDTAEFFSFRCNMSHYEANEHVRMAVALQDLPVTLSKLATGEINQQQLKYLTQFLTAETEEKYLSNLIFKSIAVMKRDAQEAKESAKKDDGYKDRGVRWWKRRFGGWRIASDLSDGEFIVARAAIERQMESAEDLEATGEHRSLPDRQADAFMAIMSARIANDNDPDRATVSIHCDVDQFVNKSALLMPTAYQF